MRPETGPVWLWHNRTANLGGDRVAALVVILLLVPQGLAYVALG